MRRSRRACVLLFAITLLAAQSASALVTVGAFGSDCQFTSIQEAINYVLDKERRQTSDIDPYIAVAGGNTYFETLNLDGSNVGSYNVFGTTYDHPFVQIYGDYDSNCRGESLGAVALVNAAERPGSVLFIHGNRSVEVILNHLKLINSTNASGNATGGGINFTGAGKLDVFDTTIASNQANYGAGIYANGSGAGIVLALHAGTSIFNNFARNAGGGIRIEGTTHLSVLDFSISIANNTANPSSPDGAGGGLQIFGSGATADIGSAGDGIATIHGNQARNGGGVAVQNGGGLRLFSAEAAPTRIFQNGASAAGGGLFVDAGYVCGSGYAINGNTAGIQNVSVGNGPAIFITGNSAGDIHLTETQLVASDGNASTQCGHGIPLPPRFTCPVGGPCNQIDDNTNIPNDAHGTITVSGSSFFVADRFEARRNTAGVMIYAEGVAKLGDCVIADNTIGFYIINAQGNDIQLNGCTVAGNILATQGSPLINMNSVGHVLTQANSILALNKYANASGPVMSLNFASGSLHTSDIIASETNSLTAHGIVSNVNSFDPEFVNAAAGDYHLRPESPAVNYRLPADQATFFATDLDGNQRGQPIAFVSGNSLFDIGAYELQNLGDTIFFNGFNPAP